MAGHTAHTTRPAAARGSGVSTDPPSGEPWRRVVTCYSVVDRFYPACGVYDLTEGIYADDPDTPLETAKRRQHDYLLDQVACAAGTRLLDVGCGYGTLMARAGQRDALAVGITISPEQLRHCRRQHLDAHLLDYRALPRQWDGTFDAVIANGSIEHFARPHDAARGEADDVYRRMFAAVHRLFDANSSSRRFVTTTIHFVRTPANPLDLLRSPFVFRRGSDSFHWAMLERGWGGYYPELGQLERCARGYFELIEEVDGTEDYHLTSEEWLRRVRGVLRSAKVLPGALRCLADVFRAPRQLLAMLYCTLSSESWNWQFRPPDPPTRLLRQTWEYRDAGSR